MHTNQITKKLTITGLCIALGIVIPMAFHTIAGGGQIFLPMHLPIIICGFVAGPVYGILCGVVCPVISSFATGMPPVFMLPGMLFELATYGFMSGLLYRSIKTKNNYLNIYIALIVSMILGRGVSGFINGVILSRYSFKVFIELSFVTALPGIVIQIILIPILINALMKARLINFENENIFGLPKRTKKSVLLAKQYFDELAEKNNENLSNEDIKRIIDIIDIQKGDKVLDIACGTGILDTELINKGASNVLGIDLSEKMIEKAKSLHSNQTNISYDVQDFYKFNKVGFDVAIVFNAYPHLLDKELFVKKLYECLNTGGKFIILHNIGIDKINQFTKDKKISNPLNSAINESKNFDARFDIKKIIDEENLYAIIGQKTK